MDWEAVGAIAELFGAVGVIEAVGMVKASRISQPSRHRAFS